MRLHVVSDVHGAVSELARAGEGADAVLCLGDLILFIDYQDHTRGILADLFGAEAVGKLVELRRHGRFAEMRRMTRDLWIGLGADVSRSGDISPMALLGGARDGAGLTDVLVAAARRQYDELFAVMPVPSYLTFGNVDLPELWPEYLRPGMRLVDGDAVEIGTATFGFVGGAVKTSKDSPYTRSPEEYAAKIDAACAAAYASSLGRLDVLCSHIPPALPELTYDVVARRFETGSTALLDAIRTHQPRYALFGHVHQPLLARTRIGRTECVNVGHFARRGTPYVLEL